MIKRTKPLKLSLNRKRFFKLLNEYIANAIDRGATIEVKEKSGGCVSFSIESKKRKKCDAK
jgi:hypothetical protein